MKKDNRGFSLIELIVVVCIMAILLAVMAASISRIAGFRAKECRTKVISSLENGRLMTLSKSKGGTSVLGSNKSATYLVFVRNETDACNYCITVIEGEIYDVKKISKGGVVLKYSTTKGATDGTAIGSCSTGKKGLSINTERGILDNCIAAGTKVAFNRQNGAFLPYNDTGNVYPYHFFASLGRYNYGISIHPSTGKVEVGERTTVTTASP